jgi:cyclopropane fatty-acyl-phospholipid synthase-like methyltransferase
MTVFDKLYMADAEYFGGEPDELLVRFCDKLDPGARVLDVGAGQGRNALFLARRGHPVDCIESSRVAVAQICQHAAKEDLPVRAFPLDFEAYDPDVEYYPVILLFGLIQELPRDSIAVLLERIAAWTRAGSIALVTAFTTGDPEAPEVSRTWRKIGRNSFLSDTGFVRTFLEPGEFKELFSGWEALHHWEGLGPEHRHGSDPPHRHGRVEAAFRKTAPG